MANIHIPRVWTSLDYDANSYEWVNGERKLKPERAAEIEAELNGKQSEAEEAARVAAAYEERRRMVAQNRQSPATPEEIEALRKRLKQDQAKVNLERLGIILPE